MLYKQKLKIFVIFWHTYCRNCQLGFSSKIEVPQLGSARLSSELSQLELARAGKFQLELITIIYQLDTGYRLIVYQ